MLEHNMIYLVGFMGVGKSTVSKALSELLQIEELDTDKKIEEEKGMSINQIFRAYGEQYFRDLETRLLKKISEGEALLVSCGGGLSIREENQRLMKKSGKVVWLTAEPETVLERVKNGKDRPLLKDHMEVDYIAKMMEERKARYEKVADFSVKTDGKSAEEIASEIVALLNK